MNYQHAFTLVELLVSIVLISALVALLLPAIQTAREAARKAKCVNRMRQIAIGVAMFESANRALPKSFEVPRGETIRGSWSVHAKILAHLEESAAFEGIDFDKDWHEQVIGGVPAFAVPSFTCPSDYQAGLRYRFGSPYVHSTSYGFNMGSWLIYDPLSGKSGDGVFRVNGTVRARHIADGMSKTMCMSEVKSFQPYIRNVAGIVSIRPVAPDAFQGVSGELKLGPTKDRNTGHTVWCDGRVHHAGITTVFAPNTMVAFSHDGASFDIDYTSQQEGRHLSRPTLSAVTARSQHSNGVNTCLMDGSVSFVSSGVDLSFWQALGTVAGQEIP